MTPAAVVKILQTLGPGCGALFGVVQGANGRLYGVTMTGGRAGEGTVFELSLDGTSYTVLHNFADGSVPNDGAKPYGALIVGIDNNLYGTTEFGGSANLGTVFKISPWAITGKNVSVIVLSIDAGAEAFRSLPLFLTRDRISRDFFRFLWTWNNGPCSLADRLLDLISESIRS